MFGPYSANKILEMELNNQPDIYVAEESDNLTWRPYNAYDFVQMASFESIPSDQSISQSVPTSLDSSPKFSPISNPTPRKLPGTISTPSSASSNLATPDFNKFNWGALAFSWIWGCFNGVYWSLVLLPLGFIPYVGGILTIAGAIALGMNGNKLAWESKKWESIEHFNRVQHNWAMAALVGILLQLAFIASFIMLLA